MDDNSLDRLFSGNLDRLPPLPKRVVRLFISSTFTDMTLERNTLMERAYPRMKKLCRERYSLDFQVVDMRWGVRDEATDDHQTVELCSREIRNCQRVSLGPNFVALIGDKYGYRPLPRRIDSNEYRSLRRSLIESDVNTDFLDTWYREDLNAVPAEYVLQPISSILKNFTNKNEPELQKLDQHIWQAIQTRLHQLLDIGSMRLVSQGRMSQQEQLMKYSISVTEREIIEGCLDVNEARRHCLVYVRSIVDIREQLSRCLGDLAKSTSPEGTLNPVRSRSQLDVLSAPPSGPVAGGLQAGKGPSGATLTRGSQSSGKSKRASLKIGDDSISLTTSGAQTAAERKVERTRRLIAKFIDLKSGEKEDGTNEWSLDEEAQEALHSLRDEKMEARLSSRGKGRNLSKYEISWHESEGVSSKVDEHKKYLNDLSEHFYAQLSTMIRRAVREEQKLRGTRSTAGLIGELLQHSHYARQVGSSVRGRTRELEQIKQYILQSGTSSQGQHLGSVRDSSFVAPMFVYGVSGSGKTSVLARTATQAREWIKLARHRRSSSIQLNQPVGGAHRASGADINELKWDREPCVIMRFCCTTPESSSMVGVLTSICRQLQFNFYQFGPLNGMCTSEEFNRVKPGGEASRTMMPPSFGPETVIDSRQAGRQAKKSSLAASQLPFSVVPGDLVRLVFTFRQMLDNCRHPLHRKRLFVIILDSIERLSSPAESDTQTKYSWLTSLTRLPPNVRLIVSCSSTDGGSLGSELAGPNLEDFRYLKRHFLRIYHSSWRSKNRSDDSDEDSAERDDKNGYLSGSRSSLSSTTSSSSSSSEDPPLNPLDAIRPELRSPSFRRTSTRASGVLKYGILKKIVFPAVRLIRGSRSGAALAKDLDSAGISPSRSVGFSPFVDNWPNKSLLFLQSRRSNVAVDEFEQSSDANEEFATSSPLDAKSASSEAARLAPGMLHIKPLGKEIARQMLAKWLLELGRNLTQQQWAIVERSFSHCSRPIFIKLTLGEVLHWKSYSAQGDTRGLTFGSAKLSELMRDCGPQHIDRLHSSLGNDLRAYIEQDTKLECLLPNGTFTTNEEREEDHRWLSLAMEQQWLNYLEYIQRRGESDTGETKDRWSGQLASDLVISINVAPEGASAAAGKGNQPAHRTQTLSSSSAGQAAGSSSLSLCHLSDTIEDAICQLFARIELQHGYLLTKHSLSYLNAARSGICENELEDVLSLDDVVLDDVFQYHLPPVRRIPPLLWTRIRSDLNDYLSERESDGIVIGWHYRQFQLVTEQRYLNDSKQSVYIHSLLADYFLGKWADRAKSFKCTTQQIHLAAEQLDSVMQQSLRDSQQGNLGRSSGGGGSFQQSNRLGSGSGKRPGASFSVRNRLRSSDQHDQRMQWLQARADRRVPQQPLYYSSGAGLPAGSSGLDASGRDSRGAASKQGTGAGGDQAEEQQIGASSADAARRRRYNMRKLVELPYHLMRSARFAELATEVFFKFRWLSAAVNSIGLQALFQDIAEALECLSAEIKVRKQQEKELQQQLKSVSDETTFEGERRLQMANTYQQAEILAQGEDQPPPLSLEALLALMRQLNILGDTLRLSASIINTDQQMLAPQLLARLLSVVGQFDKTPTEQGPFNGLEPYGKVGGSASDGPKQSHSSSTNWLRQLLQQCDQFGCLDCALLPVAQCLQSADGLQLGSMESQTGPFGVTAMVLTNDHRHLLTGSKKIFMWDISTGEIVRDFEPTEVCSCIRDLRISNNNEVALSFSRENNLLALSVQTQQVSIYKCSDLNESAIIGLKLIETKDSRAFFIWTPNSWRVFRLNEEEDNSGNMGGGAAIMGDQQQPLSQWIKIEQEYNFNLDDALDLSQLISVDIERSCLGCIDLTFLTLVRDSQMKIITLEIDNRDGSTVCMWSETHSMSARLLCLSENLRQFVYADCSDNIYLRRRRAKSWSSAKLLRPANQPTDSFVVENLQALEIESESGPTTLDRQRLDGSTDNDHRLADFERKIDAIEGDEDLEGSYGFFGSDGAQTATTEASPGSMIGKSNGLRFVKLYYPAEIVVIQLDQSERNKMSERKGKLSYPEFRNTLPRGLQNVSIDSNKCQTMSLILKAKQTAGHYLIVSATRRLLIYLLEREQLIENIDAHEARITRIIPIFYNNKIGESRANRRRSSLAIGTVEPRQAGRASDSVSLASASMDKTVKIWNLINAGKKRKPVVKLNNPIESIHLCPSKSIAACITKGGTELGVWDWQYLELVARWSADQLKLEQKHKALDPDGIENTDSLLNGSKFSITCCKFSKNGRHFLMTTTKHWRLFTINYLGRERTSRSTNLGPPQVEFALNAEQRLGLNFLLLNIKFVLQDSRCLLIGRHQKIGTSEGPDSEQDGDISNSSSPQTDSAQTTTTVKDSTMDTSRLVEIVCFTIPDGHLVYSLKFYTPVYGSRGADGEESLAHKERASSEAIESGLGLKRNRRAKLTGRDSWKIFGKTKVVEPAVTRDEQFIVALETNGPSEQTALSIFSLRDGNKVRAIDLSKLTFLGASIEQRRVSSLGEMSRAKQPTEQGEKRILVDIDQISKLTAVTLRNRSTLVALFNEVKNLSYLVDVDCSDANQILSIPKNWNGKLSRDGRYALSSKTGDFALASGIQTQPGNLAAKESQTTSAGIHLLETKLFRPIKLLVNKERLYQISQGELYTVVSGFVRPQDAYAYMFAGRSSRLFLVRLRDSHLVANYKSPVGITAVKCSKDGSNVLLLGHQDGSLAALVVVDPQQTESQVSVGHLPSRS